MAMSHKNDVSHLLVKLLWNGFSARVLVHTTVCPDSSRAQAARESVKVAFSAASRKTVPGLRHRWPQAPGFPQSAKGSAARSQTMIMKWREAECRGPGFYTPH